MSVSLAKSDFKSAFDVGETSAIDPIAIHITSITAPEPVS